MKKEVAPCARGFDKSFVYLAGAGNHYAKEPQLDEGIPRLPMLCGDGLYMKGDQFLDRQADLPTDFYSSKSFVDEMLGFLKGRSVKDKERPFFGYLAFTAPHWPLQAPKDTIAKYSGFYDDGPDALRLRRLQALVQRGLVPADAEAAPVQRSLKAWDDMPFLDKDWADMTHDEQAKSSRLMEIYAAMVDEMDQNLGRVVSYLESSGELDNTFILFMSDNGAEGALLEALPILNGHSIAEVIEQHYDNNMANLGEANSFGWYGPQWASAATAPSRAFKGFTTEGGIRCPCIVRYPPLATAPSTVSHAFTTVMDIMPTVLDLAEVAPPVSPFRARDIVPMRGKSWAAHLANPGAETPHSAEQDCANWELFGCRAVRQGPWKAVFMYPPKGSGEWELYNLNTDPGETCDLATVEPDRLKQLMLQYEAYEQDAGVFDGYLAIQQSRAKNKE